MSGLAWLVVLAALLVLGALVAYILTRVLGR